MKHKTGNATRLLRHATALCATSASLVGAFASCAQVLGVSGYESAAHDADAGSDPPPVDDAGVLVDPQPADMATPACIACLEQNCREDYVGCLADSACGSLLLDARALDRPLIASKALSEMRSSSYWSSDQTGGNLSTLRDGLRDCATVRCADPCEMGRDFSCVGKFDYPDLGSSQLGVRLRMNDDSDRKKTLPGVTIHACSMSMGCQGILGQATSGDGGFAVLSIDLTRAPVNVPTREFLGTLVFEAGAGSSYSPQAVQRSRPWLEQEYRSYSLVAREQEHALIESIDGAPRDPARVLLDIQAQDCADRPAKEVSLELWTREPHVRPCQECAIKYKGDGSRSGIIDSVLPHSSSAGSAYAVVPPGELILLIRDAATGRALSVMDRITTEAGTLYNLVIYPASREQLTHWPSEGGGL